jgi:acetyl coenzyme A synthetase (ADP forming)-like protein
MSVSLVSFFAPRRIAVIGASRKPGSLGRMLLEKLLAYRYTGKIFPINPQAQEILGLTAYPSLKDMPEKPDLAVILLPKKLVIQAMHEIGEAGIASVIVITAGFREVGAEGLALEKRLQEVAQSNSVRFIGPNCMGLINSAPEIRMNCSFSPTEPATGNVAFISQSGALGVAVLELAQERHIGFSHFVSMGNKAGLDDLDFLAHAAEDKATEVILFYFESIERPLEFRREALRIAASKPIIAIKAGRTESGAAAASSHTGALASSDAINDAFLRAAGILRCDHLSEMFDVSQALASGARLTGRNIAVLTNAGGPAILATDAIESEGLCMARLQTSTEATLSELLPEEAAIHNPVDMLASANADAYAKCSEQLLNDEGVDALLVIVVRPPVATTPKDIARQVFEVSKSQAKPVFFVIMARLDADVDLAGLRSLRLPVFAFPESAAKALRRLADYQDIRKNLTHRGDDNQLASDKLRSLAAIIPKQACELTQQETSHIFRTIGFPLPPMRFTQSVSEAIEFWQQQQKPVALKVENRNIQHKSDVGGVSIGLNSKNSIAEAWQRLWTIANRVENDEENYILVQQMAARGTEIALGIKQDANYGPFVMLGLGGVFIEVIQDVVFAPAAGLDRTAANTMLNRLRYGSMLAGARGNLPVDRGTLCDFIVALAGFAHHFPSIRELDINPLIFSNDGSGFCLVDGRIRVA